MFDFLTFKFYIMPQFKVTPHNYVRKGFTAKFPSLTVPGQVVPVRRILERFRSGQSVQTFDAVYNPDFPPGYEYMSKIDKIEAARKQSEVVSSMRSRLQKQAIEDAVKKDEKPTSVDESANDSGQ